MSEATLTLIAAIAFSIIGVGAFLHYFLTVATWPRTTGRVVGNIAQMRSDDGSAAYAYFARIEFQAADGRTYKVKGDVGNAAEWPVGQMVQLRYRPSDPNQTSTATGWQRFFFAGVFIVFGLACWRVVLG